MLRSSNWIIWKSLELNFGGCEFSRIHWNPILSNFRGCELSRLPWNSIFGKTSFPKSNYPELPRTQFSRVRSPQIELSGIPWNRTLGIWVPQIELSGILWNPICGIWSPRFELSRISPSPLFWDLENPEQLHFGKYVWILGRLFVWNRNELS